MKKEIAFILLLFFSLNLISQNQFTFERITTSDGLSDNEAICIHQDQEGFVWIGTMTGLNRFDGKNIKNFTPVSDESVLFNQRIERVYEDNFGHLWLKGFGGEIQMFDKASHAFTVFPECFDYLPISSRNNLFLHEDGFAIMVFDELGIFIVDTKHNAGELLYKYLFTGKINRPNIKGIYAQNIKQIYLDTDIAPAQLKRDTLTGRLSIDYLIEPLAKRNLNPSLLFENESVLYFALTGRGLFKYKISEQNQVLVERIGKHTLNSITCIKGFDNKLYIANNNTILGIGTNNDSLLFQIDNYKGNALGYIHQLFNDNSGNIWFRSVNFKGFFCFDVGLQKLKLYPCNFPESEYLDKYQIIISFEEDDFGNLWIGTRGNGVFYYNRSKDIIENIKNIPNNTRSLVGNQVTYIDIDNNKNVWIGTSYGISKTNIEKKQFRSVVHNQNPRSDADNRTDALYKDSYGNIWCGAYSGELYIYDEQMNLKHAFTEENNTKGFKKSMFFSFMEDSRGRMWIGSRGDGLFWIDLKKYHNNLSKAVFCRFDNSLTRPSVVSEGDIYDILEDRNGRMWIASYGYGLYLAYENNDGWVFKDYNSHLKPHTQTDISYGRCLLEDSKGKIWYGGVYGLCSFFASKKNQLPHKIDFYQSNTSDPLKAISYHDVKSIYESPNGNIWIGTTGGGLNLLDTATGQFTYYNTSDGLANNLVYATINDDEGNLWVSTKNGLSKFIPHQNTFANFSVDDGLVTNEFTESKPFVLNGSMFFGTIKGISYFNPNEIKADQKLPDILFADLLVSNTVQKVGADNILKKDINLTEAIELDYGQNNFSLALATNDLEKQSNYSIKYKLEGLDNEWFQTANNQAITYTSVPPGKYTLRIRLAPNYDESVFTERTFKIRVNPPIWRNTWAYILYTFIFVGLILVFNKMYRNNIELKHTLKLEKEVTNFKLKFFTNISHELRTPLTLIINPIKEVFNIKGVTGEGQKLLLTAQNNANTLLKLVNEILDFRKIQTQNISLSITEINDKDFFGKVAANFIFVAEQKNIEYKQVIACKGESIWIDAEKVEKTVVNLLTNAFKFTASGGLVSINISTSSGFLDICVEDTGEGFDDEMREKAFTRYYKATSKNQTLFTQGAGIGLSLVEEFVRIHKGQIKLESEKGHGSRFMVSIPCSKEAFTSEELSEKISWEVGNLMKNLNDNTSRPTSADMEMHKKSDVSILLVEDNVELSAMLEQNLQKYYNIITAATGKLGLEAAKKYSPQLIVSDVLMPEMDGIKMTKLIKEDFSLCHIPVIMLTAKSASEDFVEGYRIGADAYLTKPFDNDVLIARIENLLEQRRILQQKFNTDVDFEAMQVASDARDKEFLAKIENLVKIHLEDHSYNIQRVYEKLGYSKNGFYKKVKALTNVGPSQFIRTIKMKEAAKILKSEDLTVMEVSYRVGFSDQRYFSQQFKAHFGKTPREFLKG